MPELEIQPFSDEHLEAAASPARGAPQPPPRGRAGPARERRLSRRDRGALGARMSVRRGRDPRRRARRLPARRPSRRRGLGLEHLGGVRGPRCARARAGAGSVRGGSRGVGRARAATPHYALVPATDPELVDAWFRLSLRRTARGGHPGDARVDGRLRRRASPSGARSADDFEAATALDLELPRHQARAPAFSTIAPTAESPTRTGRSSCRRSTTRRSSSSSPRSTAKAVGELLMVPVERSSMHVGLARAGAGRLPRATQRRCPRRAARARASRLTSAGLALGPRAGLLR